MKIVWLVQTEASMWMDPKSAWNCFTQVWKLPWVRDCSGVQQVGVWWVYHEHMSKIYLSMTKPARWLKFFKSIWGTWRKNVWIRFVLYKYTKLINFLQGEKTITLSKYLYMCQTKKNLQINIVLQNIDPNV